MRENEWVVLLLVMAILLMSGVVGALNTQYGFLDGLYKYLPDMATKCVPTSCAMRYYNYGAIFYNLSTPAGDYGPALNPYPELLADDRASNVLDMALRHNCTGMISTLKKLNTTKLIAYDEVCLYLEYCGLELIAERHPENHYICLYDVK